MERSGKDWRENFEANLDHSALLGRLYVGENPIYKFPPPRAMSYPWYNLLDKGVETHCECWVRQKGEFLAEQAIVGINQSAWHLEEIIEPDNIFIAKWPLYLLRVRCERTPDSKFQSSHFDFTVSVLETENVPVKSFWEVAKLPS
jgi:hypothetical protein